MTHTTQERERPHGKLRYWFGPTGNDKSKGCRCKVCVAAKDAPVVVLTT